MKTQLDPLTFHDRRVRQHRLFALGAADARVRLGHSQLAATHLAVLSYLQRRRLLKHPA